MVRCLAYFRSICLPALALGAALLCLGEAKAAGLIAYRNDTNQVVVVQSSVTVNGVVRKGKAQMLSPGEVAVDGIILVGARRITVYDPKKPNTPLFQDDALIKDDTLLSIQPDTPAKPATPVKNPPPATKVKLVPMKLPTLPSGPSMPGPPAGKPKKP